MMTPQRQPGRRHIQRQGLLAALLTLSALAGCRRDATERSFYENVGTAFEQCNAAEIRFLSTKHNFMLSFEPCGSNNFATYAWSPDGTHLYFQMPMSHHIMNAAAPTKNVVTVPTATPVAPGTWLDANRLAVPTTTEGAVRIEVFDQTQITDLVYALPGLLDPRDLTVGTASNQLWFTAMAGGKRGVYQLDTDGGEITQPLSWTSSLADPIDTFTFTPRADAVAIGATGSVHLYRASTGESLGSWPRATRGVLHPAGQWLALEYLGDPISPFYQRAWDELSEHAREREQRRAEAFRQDLPDWYPKEVSPPRISMVNLSNGERWDFTGFLGDRFQWYEATDMYASVVLWGFEGKQLNTNVLLGNLNDRLRSMAAGETMLGIARWEDPLTPPPIDGTAPAMTPAQ